MWKYIFKINRHMKKKTDKGLLLTVFPTQLWALSVCPFVVFNEQDLQKEQAYNAMEIE